MADTSIIEDAFASLRFTQIADNWELPVMVLDQEMRFCYANAAYLEATKSTWEKLEGGFLFDHFPDTPERRGPVEEQFRRTLQLGECTTLNDQPYELAMPDGSIEMRYWRAAQEPVRDRSGNITHMLQRARDVTEEVELQRQNDIMHGELSHRIKNMFSVIMATAYVSGQTTTDVDMFVEEFTERLASMSRVYSALSESDWRGLSLRSILVGELEAFVHSTYDRCNLFGEQVMLGMKISKDVTLIVHELTAHAVKFGCFSVPEGRLSIDWNVNDGILLLNWCESGVRNVESFDQTGFYGVLREMFPMIKLERKFKNDGVLTTIEFPV